MVNLRSKISQNSDKSLKQNLETYFLEFLDVYLFLKSLFFFLLIDFISRFFELAWKLVLEPLYLEKFSTDKI